MTTVQKDAGSIPRSENPLAKVTWLCQECGAKNTHTLWGSITGNVFPACRRCAAGAVLVLGNAEEVGWYRCPSWCSDCTGIERDGVRLTDDSVTHRQLFATGDRAHSTKAEAYVHVYETAFRDGRKLRGLVVDVDDGEVTSVAGARRLADALHRAADRLQAIGGGL